MKVLPILLMLSLIPLLAAKSEVPTYEIESQLKGEEVIDESETLEDDTEEVHVTLADEEPNLSSILSESLLDSFDIPIVFNEAVEYFIKYFTTTKRKVFSNWLKRSEKYVPIMREILRENGLPEDLVYMAMIESGFNPRAYSPAKASGPWQFIYETGKRYGLRVDYWVDERRDPEKSTVAAARYLKDLFNQFGCWFLAAASYNVGEKRVEKVLEIHNTRDFWELAKYNTLPRETREYIPKLIAAAIIAKNPEQFGFQNISYDNPIQFLRVKVPRATKIEHISKAASVDKDLIRAYNPEILRGITPPDREFMIKLPSHVDLKSFEQNLASILSSGRKLTGYFPYRVKKTDTLSRISVRYGVSKEEICAWNSEKDSLKVKPGRLIYIPVYERPKSPTKVAKDASSPTLVAKRNTLKAHASRRIIYYRVKKGDTLLSIARRFGVDVESIKSLNGLRGDKVITGKTIRIPSPSERK